jgi:CTP:molybdopterin cytidylyltransferase MocA
MTSSPGPDPVDVVVLSGGINRIALFPGNRPGRKALVELNGKPLIGYVMEALREARGLGRVVVVGAPDVIACAERWMAVEGVPESRSLIENVWRGLRAARSRRVLFCNPDQPLLRTEMVEGFLDRAQQEQADIVSGWVPGELIGPYHEAEHKFCAFGDGKFAHANLFLVRRDLPSAPKVYQRIEALYGARKSTFRFAWALGPGLFGRFILSLITRRLPSLHDTLKMAGERFGVSLAPVIMPWLEVALDIDEPEDYAFAERYLDAAGAPTPERPASARTRQERAASRG